MIQSKLFVSIITLVVCAAGARVISQVPKSDNQSWNDVQVTIPLDKRTEVVFQGTLRLGDNMTDPVDERWGIRFNSTLEKHVTLQTLYFIARPNLPEESRSMKIG
jgi:hypothetical protein